MFVTGARGLRIVFSGSRATGVDMRCGGDRHIVQADQEVIVTSGAIGTPNLLMLVRIWSGGTSYGSTISRGAWICRGWDRICRSFGIDIVAD
ncbi:GMC family oxidoreductase N-terminal domain-containing protein [Komagataeibacter saccharivorans]|uniref:GMC family oxidoreductase N-terminal domain-containing protein n=1 Tax=Komagataeibacter saccharivorans TaxID=265959 RepID=UPI003570F226